MRKTITVNWLNSINACFDAVEAFDNQKETDPIKVLKDTMKINRFDWANWLIVRLMNRKQKTEYSIFAAESAIKIYEKEYPKDKRPRNAIKAAKKVLKRDSKKNRDNADNAANAAAYAADAAAYAANAAYAADADDDAADADNAAACAADAANAAAYAAYAADAANAAACAADADDAAAYAADAADAAARKKLQKKIIFNGIKILERK